LEFVGIWGRCPADRGGGIILARDTAMTRHTETQNPSPVSPNGERLLFLENVYCLGILIYPTGLSSFPIWEGREVPPRIEKSIFISYKIKMERVD